MLSNAEKKIRNWLRRHGWGTGNTPTGRGFCAWTPVEYCDGFIMYDTDSGEKKPYFVERYACLELDRFDMGSVDFSIYTRKHWLKLGNDTYERTGEVSEYPRQPVASISIPAKDLIKLGEWIKQCLDENNERLPKTRIKWNVTL